MRRDSLVMALEGDIRSPAPACDVRPIDHAAAWDRWEELSTDDNLGYPVRPGVAASRAEAAALTASRRAKCPPVRYWLAYADGEPSGFFSAWEGNAGCGVTENLFVREDMRGRGIAAALVRACVADARERGAGPIALTCNPDGWPKAWYARLGFVPVALQRTYTAHHYSP